MSNHFGPVSIRLSNTLKPSASALFQRLLVRGKFRHIQVLLKLAELGSVQRTADAIGMTQSAVTQTLAYLERLLELRLFQRHARGVRPTAVCNDLLPVARQLLQGMAQGAEILAIHHGEGQHTVRLLASAAAINGLLVQALPLLPEAVPGVEVLLREAEGEDQLLAVARAEVDLVACRRPAEVPEGWTFQPLLPDRLVVICGPGHPLTRVARTDWPALMAQEWLLMPAGTAARERFDALTAAAPGPLRTYPLITRVQTPLAWLLRERPLLAMLPLSVVRHLVDAGELVVLPVEDIGDLEPLGLLHAVQEPGEAATRFADFLRSRCAPSGLLAG